MMAIFKKRKTINNHLSCFLEITVITTVCKTSPRRQPVLRSHLKFDFISSFFTVFLHVVENASQIFSAMAWDVSHGCNYITIIYFIIPLMAIEIVGSFSLLTVKNVSWVLTSFWMISSGLIPRSEITGSDGLTFESFLIDNAKLLSWKLIHFTSSRIGSKYCFSKIMLAFTFVMVAVNWLLQHSPLCPVSLLAPAWEDGTMGSAAYRLGCSRISWRFQKGLWPHVLDGADCLINRDISILLTVFLHLSVPGWSFDSSDDQRRG